MENSWKSLNIKDKIAIISACVAFALGWILSICGFIVPPIGEVADSMLWILGQALIYAASVFGVSAYFRSETIQMKREMQNFLVEKEKMMDERLKLKQNVDEGEIP